MQNTDPTPFAEIFNQKGAVLAVFGALGGSVRAAVLKTGWRESVRVIFVGSAVAFGVGMFGPRMMEPVFGSYLDTSSSSIGALTASAFLLGLIAVTVVERIFTNIWGDKA
jgi:hypothetical protein